MYAGVLHTLGKPPRCEQFPEPAASNGEVIVHVHAASLKRAANNWPVARIMPARANSRLSAARTELGISATGNECSLADREHLTVRWHNVLLCPEPSRSQFLKA
jgi:hypothetical protein